MLCLDCFIFRVDEKVAGLNGGYSLCEARAIMEEIRQIQKHLHTGEKEKQDLMQVSVMHVLLINQNCLQLPVEFYLIPS